MSWLPSKYRAAVLTRWGGWLAALLLAGVSGSLMPSEGSLRSILALTYATIYTVVWTRMLPRLIRRFSDGGIPVLYDLLLSFVPVLIDGTWNSPFILLPLSVLVLPTLSRGLRAGFPLAACFLAIDQIVLAIGNVNQFELASRGLWYSVALIGRALLPFAFVCCVALLAAAGRSLGRRRRGRSSARPVPFEYSSFQSPGERTRVASTAPFDRTGADEPQPTRAWGKERATQPTLERRRSATLKAALLNCQPELKTAGVTVTVSLPADERFDERRLPPRVHDLLIRASEVALDNIVSHAHARNVNLALQVDDNWATLLIEDDGIGLFDGTAEPPGFHQIKRLRFRATELGGELHVAEGPKGGVELRLLLPLVLS